MSWGKICDRTRFVLTVRTQGRADADGIPRHPSACYVGEVISDDADLGTTQIGFLSLESVLGFISEMAPRSLDVLAVPEEDKAALAAVLTRAAGGTLH